MTEYLIALMVVGSLYGLGWLIKSGLDNIASAIREKSDV